ncbi:hypothetical protein ACFSO7_11380 [Bacillus sp. CGMCC 1.16607]|uniref:hypothetical protein n=1 Tax=Bacillus sp. CGMCC 1.16607 TaxID=3351842 RepID=UPI003640772A
MKDHNQIIFHQTLLGSKDIILIEMIESNEIIGKCVLSIISKEEAEISDIKISDQDNDIDNDQIYSTLFIEVVKIAKVKQLSTIYLTVSQNHFTTIGKTSVLENHLISSNWILKNHQNIFIFDGQNMNKDHWLLINHLTEDFTIDSIQSVTNQEEEEIERGKNIWYPERFYPFQYNSMGKNSLVMRFKGNIIGWCVTTIAGSNMLMYDNLFVKKEYWNLGRSISLFGKSLKIQCEESDIKYVTFTVHGDNKPLLKILHKRTLDYKVDYKELKVYELAL